MKKITSSHTCAPFWTSSLTTVSCPASDAMCSAVLPFLVAASIAAPLSKSSRTTSTWPSLDARWMAFSPFCGQKSMGYLLSRLIRSAWDIQFKVRRISFSIDPCRILRIHTCRDLYYNYWWINETAMKWNAMEWKLKFNRYSTIFQFWTYFLQDVLTRTLLFYRYSLRFEHSG